MARQLVRGNVHVAVVGDFNPQQLESLLLLYIGGLTFPEVSAVTSQEGAAAVGKTGGGSETVNPGDNCAARPCLQSGCGGAALARARTLSSGVAWGRGARRLGTSGGGWGVGILEQQHGGCGKERSG